jgi:pSer/pThr/pTyr-binding forkhead associated (FHA) protein
VLKLTIEDDEGKTTVIPVVRDDMTIGRQDGNTIRLTERNISRRHARLLRQNGTVYVEDLASFTGVKLNGARISAVMPIRDGDQIQIGDYKIVLKSDRPVERPAPVAVAVVDPPTRPTLAAARPSTPAMGSRTVATGAAAAAVAAVSAAASAAAVTVVARKTPRSEPAVARATPVPRVTPESRATPEPIEGQPTIPVRTLGEAAALANEVAPAPARLVVQSTELAGMEFMLDRASVVIGRTDENDIQLNHRSISRHHAKVVRDHDRYTIVDLQSANGVRVNGEDYERIELNPGDVVELGHVKMRFVGPFELYVFDPLAAQRSERKITNKVVFTLAGVLVAAVALMVLRRATSAPGAGAESAAVVAESSPAAAAPPTPVAAALPPPPAPAPPAPAPPDSSPRAEIERRGAVAFAKFDEASSAKNYASALDWFEAIPPDSLYKKRAQPRFEEARLLFVSEHLTAAGKFRTQGRCADAKQEADEVVKVDPDNQLAKDLVKLCRPRPEPSSMVAATTAPRPPRAKVVASAATRSEAAGGSGATKAESAPPARTVAALAPADAPADPDLLMKQAREAWIHQHCGSAIDSARRALKAKPGLSDAYQIIAVCSCSLRDVEGASRAYSKLDEKSRPLARSLCQKNGIALYSE